MLDNFPDTLLEVLIIVFIKLVKEAPLLVCLFDFKSTYHDVSACHREYDDLHELCDNHVFL
jgi:hypothetical protein